jgi:hypothetical protein
MDTSKKLEQKANKLETEAQTLHQRAQPADGQQPVSPRTKLPIDHPESQAVERIHYEMQRSLCGLTLTDEEMKKLESND